MKPDDRNGRLPLHKRPFRVLLIDGSNRRQYNCPGVDSKARTLMLRMADRLPPQWEVDLEDLGNVYGRARIQSCNACVSTSMARHSAKGFVAREAAGRGAQPGSHAAAQAQRAPAVRREEMIPVSSSRPRPNSFRATCGCLGGPSGERRRSRSRQVDADRSDERIARVNPRGGFLMRVNLIRCSTRSRS
jgi:hypothetical protein